MRWEGYVARRGKQEHSKLFFESMKGKIQFGGSIVGDIKIILKHILRQQVVRVCCGLN
jgi:hypothetical protein